MGLQQTLNLLDERLRRLEDLRVSDRLRRIEENLTRHGQGASTTSEPRPDVLEKHLDGLLQLAIPQAELQSVSIHEHVMGLVEGYLIRVVLHRCHGNQSKAADQLGINRNTLAKKISDYGL